MYHQTSQILTEAFRDFPQCLQRYVIFVVQIRPLSTTFQIYVTDKSSH